MSAEIYMINFWLLFMKTQYRKEIRALYDNLNLLHLLNFISEAKLSDFISEDYVLYLRSNMGPDQCPLLTLAILKIAKFF